jgi:hypothetical protein
MNRKHSAIRIKKSELGLFKIDGDFSVRLDGDEIVLQPDTSSVVYMNDPQHKYYKHDCNKCVYLGSYSFCKKDLWKKYDLYFCGQGGTGNTLVARYGDEGPEYLSGLTSPEEPLEEARHIAKREGLMK